MRTAKSLLWNLASPVARLTIMTDLSVRICQAGILVDRNQESSELAGKRRDAKFHQLIIPDSTNPPSKILGYSENYTRNFEHQGFGGSVASKVTAPKLQINSAKPTKM